MGQQKSKMQSDNTAPKNKKRASSITILFIRKRRKGKRNRSQSLNESRVQSTDQNNNSIEYHRELWRITTPQSPFCHNTSFRELK